MRASCLSTELIVCSVLGLLYRNLVKPNDQAGIPVQQMAQVRKTSRLISLGNILQYFHNFALLEGGLD